MSENKKIHNQSLAYKERIALELFTNIIGDRKINDENINYIIKVSDYCWKTIINGEKLKIPDRK